VKNYKIAVVTQPFYASGEVFFESTDSELVKWFLAELKKLVSSYKIAISESDLLGNPIACRIGNLSGKDSAIATWLIQQLCEKGWEPFGIEDRCYYF
jgi:hypothetical protein